MISRIFVNAPELLIKQSQLGPDGELGFVYIWEIGRRDKEYNE